MRKSKREEFFFYFFFYCLRSFIFLLLAISSMYKKPSRLIARSLGRVAVTLGGR